MLKKFYNKKNAMIILATILLFGMAFGWQFLQGVNPQKAAAGTVSDPVPQITGFLSGTGNVNDVVFSPDGNKAYLASDPFGLVVIDSTDKINPKLYGEHSSQHPAHSGSQVAISGNTAVVAGTSTGTDIVDITDSNLPNVMSSISGTSVDAAIKDSYAYIASAGVVKVVDISNPATASVKATINTATTAYGVSIIDHYAVIAAGFGGVVIADITDPLHPVLKTPLALGGLAVKIATGNIGGKNYAFVANSGLGKLQVVDISNPDSLVKVGEYSSGVATNVTYKDSKVYVSTASGMRIVIVSTPSAPSYISTLNFGKSASSIFGNYLYTADGSSGLNVLDITTPATPIWKITLSNSVAAGQLAISGNTVVAAGTPRGTDIIDITDPNLPKVMSSIAGTSVDAAIKDTYAYIASAGVVKVVDISNPATASVKATINTATTAYGVSIIDHYAVIAAGPGGIVVADIADPLHPSLKTPLALGGGLAIKIATGNIGGKNYAFVANSGLGKLQVVDISNPDVLVKVGEYSSGVAVNVTYKDNRVYVGAGVQGMHILNISAQGVPTLLGKSTVNASAVDILGNYAFLAVGSSGITIVDISNPAIIRTINTYPQFGGYTSDVLMSGNKLYAADGSAEIVANSLNLGVENITLTKTATPTSAKCDEKVIFTIMAENTSLYQEKNVVLTDPIPANATYMAGTATLDEAAVTDAWDNDDVYTSNNGTPTWTFPTFSPIGETNSSHTVSFQVKYICHPTQAAPQSAPAAASGTITSIVSEPSPTLTATTENSTTAAPSPTSSSTSTPTATTSQALSSTTAQGTIIDSKTKQPVSNATVSLVDGSSKIVETKTDANGKYTLKSDNIQPVKPYTLEVAKGNNYTAKTGFMFSTGNTSSQTISVKQNNLLMKIWLTILNLFKR